MIRGKGLIDDAVFIDAVAKENVPCRTDDLDRIPWDDVCVKSELNAHFGDRETNLAERRRVEKSNTLLNAET